MFINSFSLKNLMRKHQTLEKIIASSGLTSAASIGVKIVHNYAGRIGNHDIDYAIRFAENFGIYVGGATFLISLAYVAYKKLTPYLTKLTKWDD